MLLPEPKRKKTIGIEIEATIATMARISPKLVSRTMPKFSNI
jgi:hypothetical protein